MINQWQATAVLACALGIALWCDLARRRIPNLLIVTTLIIGGMTNLFAVQTAESHPDGMAGLLGSVLGALVGLAAMLPLYLVRAMGAGDVKLMAAVGSFLGPLPVLGVTLLTFVAGGVLSLIVALWSGTLKRVASNLRLMCVLALTDRPSGVSLRDVQTTGRLPYALAITAGTGLQIWFSTLENWPFR